MFFKNKVFSCSVHTGFELSISVLYRSLFSPSALLREVSIMWSFHTLGSMLQRTNLLQ